MVILHEISNEAKTTTETSSSSNSVLDLVKRMKPTRVGLSNTSTTKYKGVVQQQNGHWGAQIYAEHRRIWLGTFKTAAEAAAAYDSASIKLRRFDSNSHRNFPWSEVTVHEPDFQVLYTTEAVLNMIGDGSYQHKFRDHVLSRSRMASFNIMGSKQSLVQEPNRFSLACKGGLENSELKHWVSNGRRCLHATFSQGTDTERCWEMNRLVIPKKYAVKHLPFIGDDQEEGEGVEDVEVVFDDRAMRQWKFRYCYWRSSQSFVFTRGWNGFVKEKNLKEKDVIVFYSCDVPSNVQGQSNSFLMIDVDHKGSVSPKEENKMVHSEKMKTEDEETKPEEKKGGFMLFGVRIQ